MDLAHLMPCMAVMSARKSLQCNHLEIVMTIQDMQWHISDVAQHKVKSYEYHWKSVVLKWQ